MASYYNQVQDAIKNNERELNHLQEELRGLRSVEKDTPRENYQRQHAQILYHIDQEQRRLEQNKELLENYDAAQNAIRELRELNNNNEIEQLRELLNAERDSQVRRELREEIERKSKEQAERGTELERIIPDYMEKLTDELAQELRNSFLEENEKNNNNENSSNNEVREDEQNEVTNENRNSEQNQDENINDSEQENENVNEDTQNTNDDVVQAKLRNDYDKVSEEYEEAKRIYDESVAEFQRIFEEERTRREQEGPFATEEELDSFTAEYMRQKIAEDARFKEARDRMTKASRRMTSIDKKIKERAILVEKAAVLHISVEEYEKIKKTVEKKEVLAAIYEQKGLGEVNRKTQEGRETASNVTEEAITRIVEEMQEKNITNVIETINIIYGTDLQVKSVDSRQATITPEEKENVSTNQNEKVKVKKVSHAGEHKETDPVKGPPIITPEEDREVQTATTENPTEKTGTEEPAPAKEETTNTEVATTSEEKSGSSDTDDNNSGNDDTNTEQSDDSSTETPNDATAPEDVNAESNDTPLTEIPNDNSENSSTDEKKPDTRNRINPDGTYRLGKDDIIQDDLARPSRTKDIPTKNPEIPTDKPGNETPKTESGTTVPVDPSKPPITPPETGLIPVGNKGNEINPPTDDRKPPEGTDVMTIDPPQILYGPPVTEVIDVPPKPPITPPKKDQEEEQIEPPQQILYGPPVKGEGERINPPKPPITTPPVTTPTKEDPKRGLLTIMDELTDGLDLRKKDGKRYKASNIKVAEEFKKELSSGNYLYNIVHLVPAIVKLPFKLLQKVSGKIMQRASAKKNIKTLKERISKLNREDLLTIWHEYRGNRVIQERFPSILNTLLDERIQKFAMEEVTTINGELEQRYSKAFTAIKELEAIDRALADPNTSDKDKKNLRDYRTNLLKGQAENIKSIRQGYIQANEWLSGGAHGFSEDMKAATTKLSVVGKRFAKDYDLDRELLHKQAQLERAEMKAIDDGNDEMALRTFVQAETLLSSNTEIKGSIFGKRSTGKKYYSPLAEQLDYRDDPFIKDLFTTIAVTSATISTIQTIRNANNQAAIIADNNRRMAINNQRMNQVNQMGADIASKRGVMMEGMEAQGIQDTLSGANEIERAILDETDWGLGTQAYRTADQAGHAYYTSFYEGTKNAYENIAQQYAAGQINQAQAMDLISNITSKTQSTFGNINDACLNILKPYAQSHPQFDLTGVQGAMEYLQANPDAITAMNQAMVDVTNAGDILASMQLQQLIPLTTVPSTIRTVIINGAATAALANNINNSMGAKKYEYGNTVTDMVDEYAQQQAENQQSTKQNTSGK